MMFYERFYRLCVEKGKFPHVVGQELNISPGTITSWKQRGGFPNGNTLIKLADYFNCSVDYLLGRTKNRNISY